MKQSKSIKKPDTIAKAGQTVAQLQRWGSAQLASAGSEAPLRTARDLLAMAMNKSPVWLASEAKTGVPARPAGKYLSLIAARARRFPFQYLLGSESFAGLNLLVGPGVLIPRPETELVLSETVRRLDKTESPGYIADLGTGSGNLALALARLYPQARVFAVDRSARALKWARRNCRQQGLSRVRLLQGDAEKPIPRKLGGRFSLVVSNPPYITDADMKQLQPEVRFEPRQALCGGPDGLRFVRRMLQAAGKLLSPGGLFVCEIGFGQAVAVRALFHGHGFAAIQVCHDWQKTPRIVSGLRK